MGTNNRLLSDGTYRYLYDAEGNRTRKFRDTNANSLLDSGDTDIGEYTWDHRNRLVKVVHRAAYGGAADKIVDNSYDYANRWTRKVLDSNGDGTADSSRVLAYDGNQVALDFVHTGTGSATAIDLRNRYLWGPAVDELLAEETVDNGGAEDVLWALTDHQNTVRDLAQYNPGTDTTTVVNHLKYDAFGNVTAESNPAVDSLFLYTARPFDADTGLQNNLNRWYDARTGKWLSEDPIAFAPREFNLSRYVRNDPMCRTDFTGLAAFGIVDGHPVARVSDSMITCACGQAYKAGPLTPKKLKAISFCKCLVWVQQQQNEGPGWLGSLPNCPCNIGVPPRNPDPLVWSDPESPAHLQTYHPGCTIEMRSKPNAAGHGQQCCYDGLGRLITDGRAAGTPDYVAPVGPGGIAGHVRNDVTSFSDCERAGLPKFYLAYRPPNNGNNCPANVINPL